MPRSQLNSVEVLRPAISYNLKISALQQAQSDILKRINTIDSQLRGAPEAKDRDLLMQEKKEQDEIYKNLVNITAPHTQFTMQHQRVMEAAHASLLAFEEKLDPAKLNDPAVIQALETQQHIFNQAHANFKEQALLFEKRLKVGMKTPIEQLSDGAQVIWQRAEVAKDLINREYSASFTPSQRAECVLLRLKAIGEPVKEQFDALTKAVTDYNQIDSKIDKNILEAKLIDETQKAFTWIAKKVGPATRFIAAEEKIHEYITIHNQRAFEEVMDKTNVPQQDLREALQSGIPLEFKTLALSNTIDLSIIEINEIDKSLADEKTTEEARRPLLEDRLAKETILKKMKSALDKVAESNVLKEKMLLSETLFTNSLIAKAGKKSPSIEQNHALLENNFTKARADYLASIPIAERAIENSMKNVKVSEFSKKCLARADSYTKMTEKDFSPTLTPSQKASCLLLRLSAVGQGESEEAKKLSAALEQYIAEPKSKQKLKVLNELCLSVVPTIVQNTLPTTEWTAVKTKLVEYAKINTDINESFNNYYFPRIMAKNPLFNVKAVTSESSANKKKFQAGKPEDEKESNDYNLALSEFNKKQAIQKFEAAFDIANDDSQVGKLLKKHDEITVIRSIALMLSAPANYGAEHKKLMTAQKLVIMRRRELLDAVGKETYFSVKKTVTPLDPEKREGILYAKKLLFDAVLAYQDQEKITENMYRQYSQEATQEVLEEEKANIQSKRAAENAPDAKVSGVSAGFSALERLELSNLVQKIQTRIEQLPSMIEKAEYVSSRLILLGPNTPIDSSYQDDLKKARTFSDTDFAALFNEEKDESKVISPIANVIKQKIIILKSLNQALAAEVKKNENRSTFSKIFTGKPPEVQAIIRSIDDVNAKLNNLFDIALKVITNTSSSILKSNAQLPDLLTEEKKRESSALMVEEKLKALHKVSSASVLVPPPAPPSTPPPPSRASSPTMSESSEEKKRSLLETKAPEVVPPLRKGASASGIFASGSASGVDLGAARNIIASHNEYYSREVKDERPAAPSAIVINRWREDKKSLSSLMEKLALVSPTDYKQAEQVLKKIEDKLKSVTVTFHRRST